MESLESWKDRKIRSCCNHNTTSTFVFITTCIFEPKSLSPGVSRPSSHDPRKRNSFRTGKVHCITANYNSTNSFLWEKHFIQYTVFHSIHLLVMRSKLTFTLMNLMTDEWQKCISCQMTYCNCSSNTGSVVFAQLPLVAHHQGSDRSLLSKVIPIMGSSIRISHQIHMAAVSFGNI